MDAHLRWDCDSLVLRRLGRWSQLHNRTCVLEICFNLIRFYISNVPSTSVMEISVCKSAPHVAQKCKCVRLVIYVLLCRRSLQGSQRLCCLLLSIWLRHLLLHLSCHLKLHFPACHHLIGSASATKMRFFKKLLWQILHLISLTILVRPRCKTWQTWPPDLTLWK